MKFTIKIEYKKFSLFYLYIPHHNNQKYCINETKLFNNEVYLYDKSGAVYSVNG